MKGTEEYTIVASVASGDELCLKLGQRAATEAKQKARPAHNKLIRQRIDAVWNEHKKCQRTIEASDNELCLKLGQRTATEAKRKARPAHNKLTREAKE